MVDATSPSIIQRRQFFAQADQPDSVLYSSPSVTMKATRYLLSLAAILQLAACNDSGTESADQPQAREKPQVYATNYPLKWFADKMAGDFADIVYPAPSDEDPAFWKPDDETVSKFQQADVILMNGATYSKWADKVTLPASKIVDTSASFWNGLYHLARSPARHPTSGSSPRRLAENSTPAEGQNHRAFQYD